MFSLCMCGVYLTLDSFHSSKTSMLGNWRFKLKPGFYVSIYVCLSVFWTGDLYRVSCASHMAEKQAMLALPTGWKRE